MSEVPLQPLIWGYHPLLKKTESAARVGLYLLVLDVTMQSHSGHPTRGCIPRCILRSDAEAAN